MGNTESKEEIDINKNIIIHLEIHTFFHNRENKEYTINFNNLFPHNEKEIKEKIKKYVNKIVKTSFLSLNYKCMINTDNIFIEVDNQKDEFLSIGVITKLDPNIESKQLNKEVIKLSILYAINYAKSYELDENIFIKFEEKNVIDLLIHQ